MQFRLIFLLLLAVHSGTWAQTPFTTFLKSYIETKGVEVGQQNINPPSMPDKPVVLQASLKTVTVDDEYPKVLKAFRRNVESLLAKSYSYVSFTKDADNEDINTVYKFIRDSTVELVHYQKEEDQVTLHVFEIVFKNIKEEELRKMPLTINMNQQPGSQPIKLNFFPAQQGNPVNGGLPKTDSTKQGGHGPFQDEGASHLPGRDD